MTRQLRQQSSTGIHHVMLRGINRQIMFENDDDYRKFIFILHDLVAPKDQLRRPLPPRCAIYAYCLMTNHVHLLIQEKDDKLPNIIRDIASRYAMYYNNRYEHFGHLFQDRYKSEPVNDAAYFLTLIRYIHQNPVAGGLSNDVESYDWSSWREFTTDPKRVFFHLRSPSSPEKISPRRPPRISQHPPTENPPGTGIRQQEWRRYRRGSKSLSLNKLRYNPPCRSHHLRKIPP